MDAITLQDVVTTWKKIVVHDYGRINIRIYSKAMFNETNEEKANAQEKNREYYKSYKV